MPGDRWTSSNNSSSSSLSVTVTDRGQARSRNRGARIVGSPPHCQPPIRPIFTNYVKTTTSNCLISSSFSFSSSMFFWSCSCRYCYRLWVKSILDGVIKYRLDAPIGRSRQSKVHCSGCSCSCCSIDSTVAGCSVKQWSKEKKGNGLNRM